VVNELSQSSGEVENVKIVRNAGKGANHPHEKPCPRYGDFNGTGTETFAFLSGKGVLASLLVEYRLRIN
jgi:hypothetical protein